MPGGAVGGPPHSSQPSDFAAQERRFKFQKMASEALKTQLDPVPKYNGTTAVAEFEAQVQAAFSRVDPGLLAFLSDRDLASAAVGRLDGSLRQLISSHEALRAPTSCPAVFAALHAVFPTDRLALLTHLRGTLQAPGTPALAHCGAIRRLYAQCRVPLPTTWAECGQLIVTFRKEVADHLQHAFSRLAESEPVSMAQIEQECQRWDARAAIEPQRAALEQHLSAAAPNKPRQQQQRPPQQQQYQQHQQQPPRHAAVEDGGNRKGAGGQRNNNNNSNNKQQQRRGDSRAAGGPPEFGLGDTGAAPDITMACVRMPPLAADASPEQQQVALSASLMMAGPLQPFSGAGGSGAGSSSFVCSGGGGSSAGGDSSSAAASLAAGPPNPSNSSGSSGSSAGGGSSSVAGSLAAGPGASASPSGTLSAEWQLQVLGNAASMAFHAPTSLGFKERAVAVGRVMAVMQDIHALQQEAGGCSSGASAAPLVSSTTAGRRRPRGAEVVVPGSAAIAQPGESVQPSRSTSRVHHVVGRAPLGMSVEDLAVAVADPAMEPFREAIRAVWRLLFPDSPVPPAQVLALYFCDAAPAGAPSTGGTSAVVATPAAAVCSSDSGSSAGGGGSASGAVGSASGGANSSSSSPVYMGVLQALSADNSSSSGSSTSFAPACVGAVPGPAADRSSSGSDAPYAAYKAALHTDTVVYQSCQQITVPGDFNGRPVRLMVDPGAAFSCVSLEWLKRNHHLLFYPGSSAELCRLSVPRELNCFVPGNTVRIEYVVRNAALGLGDGLFPITFQVVPGAAFDLTLGLDFLWGYAVRLVPRHMSAWDSGARLLVPVPQQYRRRGEAPPPPAWWRKERGDTPFVPFCVVRAQYSVRTERALAAVLNPSCLDSL
jgi:hypothetical protein